MGDTGTRQFDIFSAPVKEPGASEGEMTRVVDMFRRRLWVVMLTAALVFLAVAFMTASATKLYTATAEVQLDLQRKNILGSIETAVTGAAPDAGAVDTETQILSSRTLIARVVETVITGDKYFHFFDTRFTISTPA